MEVNNYVKLAMNTKNPALNRKDLLCDSAMGLAGESGEVSDTLKKHLFQGHELKLSEVVEELGDTLWYIALLCDTLELDLEMVMVENIHKLSNRYPEGFSEEDSINRK